MLDFHKDNREVVDKEHGIQHGIGIINQILILDATTRFVENADAVKEPEGENEDE